VTVTTFSLKRAGTSPLLIEHAYFTIADEQPPRIRKDMVRAV
jgi:hypothetical protein